MIRLVAVLMAMISATVSARGQASGAVLPFESYMAAYKAHRMQPRFEKAALRCGLHLSAAHAVYGASVSDTLAVTLDFAKGVYELESDFFWTAALWSDDTGNKVLDVWSVDDSVVAESDAIVCVAKSGQPITMQVINWSIPADNSSTGWAYSQVLKVDSNGKVLSRSGEFMDITLQKQIARPAMDADDKSFSEWVLSSSIAHAFMRKLTETGKK